MVLNESQETFGNRSEIIHRFLFEKLLFVFLCSTNKMVVFGVVFW